MKLSPRLQKIADFIQKNSIVADIGTDHGYLPVYLIENKISQRVIATDVNEGPLNSAREFVTKKGLQDKINTRLGDGLKILKPNEVDTVIIAGMGGLLISKILEESENIARTVENFVLQPMVAQEELRKFLFKNKYKIIDEGLAKEGNKIYEIIHVQHGIDSIDDEIYFEVGKRLIEKKDPLLGEFINRKIIKTGELLERLQEAQSIRGKEKYRKLKKNYDKLLEVLNKL